jgi:NADPH:quinone reductase-like Zn-dependent oxidoreductase
MKALVLDKPGTPETLYASDVEKPQPESGEVRVKVHAVGLNPVDYKLAASGFPGWRYPVVLGSDVAGVVDAVGKDVEDWQVGDPVYFHGDFTRPFGASGFSQYAVITSKTLAWMPAGLNYQEAAALPTAGFTAFQALHRKLRVHEGKTLLVVGGAGGVGGFAVQLAKLAGLTTIATCSRHNIKFVQDLGAQHVIDYQTDDVEKGVEKFTKGVGVDYILDTVSSESATSALKMLAFGGGIACVAGLPDITTVEPFTTGLSVHEIALSAAYVTRDEAALEDLARIGMEFGVMASKKQIRPMVEEIVTFEDIPEALMRLSMRHVRGKIVAKIPQTN